MPDLQRFYICVRNEDTGERREFTVGSFDPESALRVGLRRKPMAEWLLSEHRFRFVVSDRSTIRDA